MKKHQDAPLSVLASMVLLLSGPWGCATGTKVAGGGTYSEKAVLLEVSFQRQADPTLCGLAAAEMLAQYYGEPLPEADQRALKGEAAEKKGIAGASLGKAFKSAGYHTAIFPATLDREPTSLYHHLDLGRPLIVMLAPAQGEENHYQLVTGYDPERSLISLLDPARGPLAMPLAQFKAAWERANSFTFLAVPRGRDEAPPKD